MFSKWSWVQLMFVSSVNVQLMVVGSLNGRGYSYSTSMSLTEIPKFISYKHATLFRASKPNSLHLFECYM